MKLRHTSLQFQEVIRMMNEVSLVNVPRLKSPMTNALVLRRK